MPKDPRLERAGVSGFNKPKRTPSHPTKSHVVVAKEGDKIGSFTFVHSELVGKNKTWVVKCTCGEEKRFWKYSAITRQKSCGCGTDECGLTKEQRRMLNSRIHSYKSGARKRGFSWELSYESFHELTTQDCVYCGEEPKELNYFESAPSLRSESPHRDWSKYTIKFNGIDRVDSSLGYNLDNCVPCCTRCNRAKNDMSFEEFKGHIRKVYQWLHQTG